MITKLFFEDFINEFSLMYLYSQKLFKIFKIKKIIDDVIIIAKTR